MAFAPALRGPAAAIVLACMLAVKAGAQSCLGYPAFPTGPVNVSVSGVVGADYGGASADVNVGGKRRGGPFGSLGLGAIHYVTEPKENRASVGGLFGWERYNKDLMIFCPFVSGSTERGSEISDGLGGTQRITGSVLSVGMGMGFELPARRRGLSYNPFISLRYAHVQTRLRGGAADSTVTEGGAVFGFGLGVRFREAIQVTPSFSAATLSGSNLVFELRLSAALEFRKN